MPTPREGYRLASGEVVPGTTTILGRFDDKGALMYWAFNKGLTAGLAGEKFARLYDKKEEADIGTHVHDMILEDLHGRELPAFPLVFTDAMKEAATNAFENYKREIGMLNAFIMPIETPLVSEQYKYGGTLDGVMQYGEVLDGLDWKSSKSIYTGYLIQGAAYRQLWNENHPNTPMDGFRVYRFAKEDGGFGQARFSPKDLDLAFKQFLLFREAFELDKQLKRKV